MTPTEIAQYFQLHNANMKLLEIGYDEIRNQIKSLYRSKNKSGTLIYSLPDNREEKIVAAKKEKCFSRILSGIQVSLAEESIKRLFYEGKLFSSDQRNYLIERDALDKKWYNALHITFCIAYDLVPPSDPFCIGVNINSQRWNLGDELVDRYFELKKIITDYLVPNFSIRNKVQHGEWEYAFKPRYSKEYSTTITANLNHENIITTTSRFTLVNAFYQLLVELGRFRSNSFAIDSIQTPFEYFYDDYLKKIRHEIEKIKSPKLEIFITELVAKEMRASSYQKSQRKAI
jgi:hypothetical protein